MNYSRKELIENRMQIPNREEKDKRILKNLLELLEDTKEIFVYVSEKGEADTKRFIEQALALKKVVCCPKVRGEKMDFYRIHDFSDLKPGAFGIPEPCTDELKVPKSDSSMIIPGLGFSEKGDRIGYGKGFYDRYLSKHPCHKIGLAYEMQLFEALAPNPWDVPMEKIVTEERIVRICE